MWWGGAGSRDGRGGRGWWFPRARRLMARGGADQKEMGEGVGLVIGNLKADGEVVEVAGRWGTDGR